MVLKCRIKPIGYICFPFLLLAIILWNVNNKAFNINQGVSIKELVSATIHLVSIAGKELYSEYLITQNDSNFTHLNFISTKILLSGYNHNFPHLKMISVTDLDYSHKHIPIFLNKNLGEIDNLIHSDLVVSSEDILVWINPLDGTNDYSEGIHYVTISICITFQSRPIAAFIHHVFSNRTYWTWLGHLKPKIPRKISNFKRIIVSKSFSNSDLNIKIRELFVNQSKVEAFSGTGFKTILMINGTADYFYSPLPLHKCNVCIMHVFISHFKGFIFSWPKVTSKSFILNKVLINYKEIFTYSEKSNKWIPNLICGIK